MMEGTINLMCFHIPSPDADLARKYLAMYQVMAQSARNVGIRGEFHFLTHETSQLPADLRVDRILRIPASVGSIDELHRLRVHGWHLYVSSGLFDHPTIAVDTDVLFQKNPAAAFTGDFDVGMTYECITKRHWEGSGKINAGVMFLDPRNKAAVMRFFDDMVRQLEKIKDLVDERLRHAANPPPLKTWGGDEAAIMAMFPEGSLASKNQEPKTLRHGEAIIRTFPSMPWNCQQSTTNGAETGMPYVEEACIRHFCGVRKRVFFDYAKRHLGITATRDTASPLGVRVANAAPLHVGKQE